MSRKTHTFGFLSTIDNPLLPAYISSALIHNVKNIVVICDSNTEDEKSRLIWQERTGGRFQQTPGIDDSLYSLGDANIPFFFVKNHNDNRAMALLDQLNVTCLFNAGTPRKLSGRVISSVPNGVINVHPGLLPEYRGCTAVEWSLFNNDKVGNTAHFMDEEYDTGPIILSEWYQFQVDSDYQSIRLKVYREGCNLAGRILSQIQQDDLTPKDSEKQDPSSGQYREPISPEKMADVHERLQEKRYRYQVL